MADDVRPEKTEIELLREELSQAKEEQESLREALKTVLDELTYKKIAEEASTLMQNVNDVFQKVPYGLYVG